MVEHLRSSVRVEFRGRVQGVGFRAFVADAAQARDLSGWVRNRRNGSVEAVFVGQAEDVAAVIGRCRAGPKLARVDDVQMHDVEDEGWADFSVLGTA